jgi:hypothetical protein
MVQDKQKRQDKEVEKDGYGDIEDKPIISLNSVHRVDEAHKNREKIEK